MMVYRDSVPEDSTTQLRDMVLELAGRAVTGGQAKVTLRKLFVAVRRLPFAPTCTIGNELVMTDYYSCNETSSRPTLPLA